MGNIISPADLIGKAGNAIVVNSAEDGYEAGDSPVNTYKVYTALLTQSGANAPVATVLKNSLSGAIVWTRISAGTYNAALVGAFPVNKTLILLGSVSQGASVVADRQGDDSIRVYTLNAGNAVADSMLNDTAIEIRVYP